jgi:transcriptional regulator with XRE-family HTH domain
VEVQVTLSHLPRESPEAWRAARLKAGLTHTEAAVLIGRSAGMIVGYESGRWRPSWDVVLAISAAYRVPVDDFLARPTRRRP